MDCANFVFDHARGPIFGYISSAGLKSLWLPQRRNVRVDLLDGAPNVALGKVLRRELERYFAGIAVDFSDIPLDLEDATPFRGEVWLAARTIRWGETASYAGLAQRMGRPAGAARGGGQPHRPQPHPNVNPCHRILAADGSLGGFSAGLNWKRELLHIEKYDRDRA
jgi:methylated-DNA-[protein]-cysteine S-methyltransferase